jgi:hypothetical protein
MNYGNLNDGAAGKLPGYMKPPPGPSATPVNNPTYTPTPAPPDHADAIAIPGSGYTPDYTGLISNDPGYQSAQAAAKQAQAMAAAQRKQMLQQAIIRYGGLPDGFKDQYGDIDQSVLDQARQNQNSVLAQLANNYSKSQDQFRRGLAARGALQSGDLNYGQDQLDQGYSQQRYDAANNLGNDVNGALSQYMGVIQGNANNLSSAIQGAEANVYNNPSYRPTPDASANYDAANSHAYGQPIYVDSSGNMYDMNGNPFSPPSASAAANPYDDPYVGNARTPGVQM